MNTPRASAESTPGEPAARTVLVTGASRGLGREIALAFAREHAHVWVGYHVRAVDADATLALVRQHGGTGSTLALDVTDVAQVEQAVQRLLAERGALDVLVNCAGVTQDGWLALMSEAEWRLVIEVNLNGAFRCCRAVVPSMIARRSGAIINVASIAGMRASPGQANYAAAKGGLLAFTKTLAAELAGYAVRVNAVVPGLLSSGMAARLERRVLAEKQRQIPIGRLGEPREVAEAVTFLASERASYIVGQALVVDGGLGG